MTSPGKLNPARWYDIRIELSDTRIKCYLDGKLIHDVTYPVTRSLYAVASRGPNHHETILKVVNVSRQVQPTRIMLTGGAFTGTGTAIVLSSDQPQDENSLDQPLKVVPTTHTLACSGTGFSYNFPANSVTVLRLPFR